MKQVHPQELEAIVKLPAARRYDNFIKTVSDWEEVWGLYDDGWAISETGDGKRVLPLWPARAFAEACAVELWVNYEPKAISLSDFLEDFLPDLTEEGILPGVAYTLEQGSVDVKADQLAEDLRSAYNAYE